MSLYKRIYELDNHVQSMDENETYLALDRPKSLSASKISIKSLLKNVTELPPLEEQEPNLIWARQDGDWVPIQPDYLKLNWNGIYYSDAEIVDVPEQPDLGIINLKIDGYNKYAPGLMVLVNFNGQTLNKKNYQIRVNDLGARDFTGWRDIFKVSENDIGQPSIGYGYGLLLIAYAPDMSPDNGIVEDKFQVMNFITSKSDSSVITVNGVGPVNGNVDLDANLDAKYYKRNNEEDLTLIAKGWTDENGSHVKGVYEMIMDSLLEGDKIYYGDNIKY